MARSHRAVSTNNGNGTAVSLTQPAGIVAGDFAIAVIDLLHNGAATTPVLTTEPGGWTGSANNPLRYAAASWSHTTYFYLKVLTQADVDSWDFSATVDATVNWCAGLSVVTADGTLSLDQEDSQKNGGEDTTIEYPALSGVPALSASLCIGAWKANWASHTPSTGYTERFELGSSPNAAAQDDLDVSGTVAPAASTLSGSSRQNSFHVTCAEAVAGGGSLPPLPHTDHGRHLLRR